MSCNLAFCLFLEWKVYLYDIFKNFLIMDWKVCIICQAEMEENLRCTISHVSYGALTVYTNFMDNVNEFRKFDALAVQLVWGNDITADVLYDKCCKLASFLPYQVCQSKSGGQDKGKKEKTKH